MSHGPSMPVTAHLTNAFHPTSGGIRTFYRALLAGAEQRERPMHLIVPSDRAESEPHGRFGRIHHVAAKPAPGVDRRYRLLTPRHYLRPDSPVRLLLAGLQPDLVEICDKYTLPPLAWALRRSGAPRPTLVGLSCERMDDNVAAYLAGGSLLRTGVAAYMRRVYLPPFDAHAANSNYTAAELRAGGREVHVCGMGVDVETFTGARRDESLRTRLLVEAGGAASSALVLFAGRLSPEKHLDVLIDAVARITRADLTVGVRRDLRLVLVGDGPHAPRLLRAAGAECPGRVRILPHLTDRRELAAHYAAADVVVHPNPREPFGIGPLEAMAAGAPVVVPRAGGVLSYAHPGNAWLAEPGVDGLAEAIVAALGARPGDPRLASARRTACDRDWPRVADRYFALLDRLHAARRAVAPAMRPLRPAALTSR